MCLMCFFLKKSNYLIKNLTIPSIPSPSLKNSVLMNMQILLKAVSSFADKSSQCMYPGGFKCK